MYVVKAKNAADNGWTTIYDSSDKALCQISQPKHSSEMNQPGSFDFTIYPDCDFYNTVIPMDTFISAFEGNDAEHLEETFYGRVLTCEEDFYGVKNVGCEGALSFLTDATVGYVSTEHRRGMERTVTPQMFVQDQLTAYNAKVEERKQLIYSGTIDPEDSTQLFKIDDFQDYWSIFESQLIDVNGGFFRITRQQNGTHQLSYVDNYGIDAGTAQPIKLGQNILDKQKHTTGDGVFTFIRPVGKDNKLLDPGTYHGVLCDDSNGRSGLYPVGTDAASFNALYARYGYIEKAKTFDDCETRDALAAACRKYVNDYGLDALDKLPMTFDVKLVDFFNVNPNVKRVELGANYILTIDNEGRETGFEGHAAGDSLQEGQQGLTLTVYSINREYENPENDSITFYNATYLTAKDFSIILSSMTGSSGSGGSRSGLSGYMASSDAEMRAEQAEEARRVETRFIDDEESIGMVITVTEDGKVINAGGIWAEVVDLDGRHQLQGTLDVDRIALRNNAVVTAINTDTQGERSIKIDLDRIQLSSNAIIDVINNNDTPQGETQLTINVDRLDITGILAAAGLDVVTATTTYLRSTYGISSPTIRTTSLSVGEAGQAQGETVGEISFRGDNYYHVGVFMGGSAQGVADNIVNMGVLGFGPTIRSNDQHVNLNHAHAVSMSETNDGQVKAVIGLPVSYNVNDDTNRRSFFDIAASDTYVAGVAAARSSVYAKKGTWANGAVAINPYYMNGSTETYAGGSGTVVNLIASVPTVSEESDVPLWINGNIEVRVNDGTVPTGLTHTVSIPSSSATWSAQKISDTSYAVTCHVGGAAINKPGGLDTTGSYNAGSYAVTLNNPDWGTAPSPLTANRTVSVWTSGRVNSGGVSDELHKDISVTLQQGTWSNDHKMLVGLQSSGMIRAQTEVNASEVYNAGSYAGWNSAASAVLYPGTASGQVLNATLTLPNTGASSSTPAPTKDVLFRVEKSATPSANAAVTAQYSTNNGSTYTKFLRINVGNMYTAGWDAASALTVPPSGGTVGTSFVFKAPKTTTDQQGNVTRAQTTFNFVMTKGANPSSNGYAAVEFGGQAVGQIPIGDWYDAGWDAARRSVGNFPESTPQTLNGSITVYKPSSTVGGEADPYTYTLRVDSSYVYLDYGINPVARIANTASQSTIPTAAQLGLYDGTSNDVQLRGPNGSGTYNYGGYNNEIWCRPYGVSTTFSTSNWIRVRDNVSLDEAMPDATAINIANEGSLWSVGGWNTIPPALAGKTIVDLNALSDAITDSDNGDSVIFRACIGPESEATSFKYYRLKIGYSYS